MIVIIGWLSDFHSDNYCLGVAAQNWILSAAFYFSSGYAAQMKYRKAFSLGLSLLEVLVVLAIISLLGQVSVSGWQDYKQRLYLHEASDQLVHFLRRVQIDAGWHNRTYSIVIEHPAGSLWQVVIQGAGNPDCGSASRYCYRPGSVGINLLNESLAQNMKFYGRSGAANAGQITLSNGRDEVKIILSAKGRLRRCSVRGSLSGLPPC